MKKVLRGALVAGVALAASVGFGASASAVESDRADATEVSSADGVNILNNACVLPWFWQGPFNVVVENQDGSYSACNGMAGESGDGVNIGENACILPWFWQGPFNVFLGNQNGEYEACNGSAEIPADVQEKLGALPEGTELSELTEQGLLDLLPEGTTLLPKGS